MNNNICKKVESMLCLYIEDKLSLKDKLFVENHFLQCSSCYNKYMEMKEIINNLHLEYAKLINEFKKAEEEKVFNIREYENFYQNISPYIDDELCYEDSIKFRKYLLRSKSARGDLASAYNLKNNIKNSIDNLKDKININFSKKIVKQLQDNGVNSFEILYRNVGIAIAFLISTFVLICVYLGFNYMNEAFAKESDNSIVKSIEIPNEDDMIEFTFDMNEKPIIVAK